MARYVKTQTRVTNQLDRTDWVLDSEIGGGSFLLETPTGAINGSNKAFVFTVAPIFVTYQGIIQTLNTDYTLSGMTATFAVAPVSGLVQGLVSA